MVSNQTCSQRGKDPVPSCSSPDSDCASLPDLDTSAVYVHRKMKVWLSHNKLTHASSAPAGTCTAVTMWWHSLLCNNPSATLSAAWGPVAACAAVPPPLQSRMLVRAKLPQKENYASALARCALSPQLHYPYQMRSSQVQFLHKVSSVHLRIPERRGWSLCLFPALDAWQQLSWWLNGLLKGFVAGTFVEQRFPIHTCSVISAPNYSRGTFLFVWLFVFPEQAAPVRYQ